MFDSPFYNATIKKTIIGFGALFSSISIPRKNNAGVLIETVRVPIAYGPKEKFINRIDADPELNAGVLITLPRLAFEVTGYNFNSGEMTNRNNKIQCQKPDGTQFTYTPVPYDISIQLSLLQKGTEDSLTVLEQILPLFTPEYTLTVNVLPEMNLTLDFPIILNGVSVQDDYEGDFSNRRLVTHTFDFTAKIKLIGPVRSSGLITRTEVTLPTPINTQHISTGDIATGDITLDEWKFTE